MSYGADQGGLGSSRVTDQLQEENAEDHKKEQMVRQKQKKKSVFLELQCDGNNNLMSTTIYISTSYEIENGYG